MLSALISQRDQTITQEVLQALSPEFFMQVEWLPGGRFEESEFVPDPIFDEADDHPEDENLLRLCDPLVRGFIFNLIREYGGLDYVNVGRIPQSLSKRQLPQGGRRAVYLAEVMIHGAREPLVRFIRFQKWGIRERLDEGKPLLAAILESEEYTDYVLDRRLGVMQLGMHVPPSMSLRRTRERYFGANRELHGQFIPVVYFEREYLRGLATDRLRRASGRTARPRGGRQHDLRPGDGAHEADHVRRRRRGRGRGSRQWTAGRTDDLRSFWRLCRLPAQPAGGRRRLRAAGERPAGSSAGPRKVRGRLSPGFGGRIPSPPG
jgi:hypothetical protein